MSVGGFCGWIRMSVGGLGAGHYVLLNLVLFEILVTDVPLLEADSPEGRAEPACVQEVGLGRGQPPHHLWGVQCLWGRGSGEGEGEGE